MLPMASNGGDTTMDGDENMAVFRWCGAGFEMCWGECLWQLEWNLLPYRQFSKNSFIVGIIRILVQQV